MHNHRDVGRKGERWARHFLENQGWVVVEVNARTPYGEVDLVAREHDQWVFVEVKTRRSHAFGHPEDAITPQKLRRLAQAAQHWLDQHNIQAPWRIDVLALYWPPHRKTPHCEHFRDVQVDWDAYMGPIG